MGKTAVHIGDLLFSDLKGLIEVREIDKENASIPKFFTSLEAFKSYKPPTDKNIYFGMFSRSKRKGNKEHCLQTNVLWADYDNVSLKEAKKQITKAGIPEPSILINSGNGIHSYWLLDKKAGKGIEDVLKAIAIKSGADTKAAEVARIMRLPDSYNVKGDIPKLCEVVEVNENRYPLELFISILDVKEEPEQTEIDELSGSKMACIRLIAKGVGKGQRNFALGKITAFMKQQGMSRKKAFDIANSWNKNNTPVKTANEIKDEFNRFWDSDYKYLGCKFTNPDLERINKQLCPIGECQFHVAQSMQVINSENATMLDNELFKRTIYPKIKGLDIAIYSTIATAKTIDREHLGELVKRHTKDRLFIQAIKNLQAIGYIEVQKGIDKKGIPDKLILSKKSNYGRGYTPVSLLLTKLYIAKELNENEYKLLVLLKSYSYGKGEVYPTIETLADKLGITERSTTRLLEGLDHQLYIKRNYKPLDNGKTKLIISIQF